MNKKAMILYYLVVPGFVLALVYFLILAYSANPEQAKEYTGERALLVLSAAQEGQKMLLYADKAAPLAAYDAVSMLAETGGFEGESPCGRYFGYNLWGKKCIPEINKPLETLFNQKMDTLLQRYPPKPIALARKSQFSMTPAMGSSYYHLFTYGKEIAGSRAQPVKVALTAEGKPIGEYTILPNFHVMTAYNFDHIRAITQNIQTLFNAPSPDIDRTFASWNQQPGIAWQLNACAPIDEKELFYSFAERLQECIDAPTTNCRCSVAAPFSLLTNHGIFLEAENGNVVVRLRDINDPGRALLEHKIERSVGLSFLEKDVKTASEIAFYWNTKPFVQIKTDQGLQSPRPIDMVQFFKDDTVSLMLDKRDVAECARPKTTLRRICVGAGELPDQKAVTFKIALDLS